MYTSHHLSPHAALLYDVSYLIFLSLNPLFPNKFAPRPQHNPTNPTAQLACSADQEHCALPDYVEFKPQQPVELSSVLSAASPDAMDLLLQLLVLRPDKRATAREALRHPFFTKHEPKPCAPSELALPIPEERKHKVRQAHRQTDGAAFGGTARKSMKPRQNKCSTVVLILLFFVPRAVPCS